MTLWLIGMMGSGKTSAGRRAAEIIGVPFVDTDDEIASRMGCSVAQLWGELGETAFRDLERSTVQRLAGSSVIVGTGGGAVLDESNRNRMRESGTVIWLTASAETLASRVGTGSGRPLLAADAVGANLASILGHREEAYAEAAHSQVDTGELSVEQVAQELAKSWSP